MKKKFGLTPVIKSTFRLTSDIDIKEFCQYVRP